MWNQYCLLFLICNLHLYWLIFLGAIQVRCAFWYAI